MATLSGTQDDDRLIGTEEDDRIFGLEGNDFIAGRAGHDWLAGGPGDDQIFGNAGDDRLLGLGGNDDLRGGVGNDTLIGHAGNDTIAGGPGNDRAFGHAGNDRIFGHGGDDSLFGGPGDDLLAGGPGEDQLFGHAGADRMLGHDGDDGIAGLAGADILTGGPGADKFIYGNLTHAGDRITDFNPGEGDELVLVGALQDAEEVRVVDGDDTIVSVRPTDAQSFTDLLVLENFVDSGSPPPERPSNFGPIDVWYGDVQSFGDPGVAQRWVNILGNVETRNLDSLTFSLNDGPEQTLATGRNNTRLARQGDFNVELDFARLDPSAADDVVTIRAAYSDGREFERAVTIDYEGGKTWPANYSIDWAQVSDLQDVVQVVDGKWSFDENGVRPEIPGYDRILAIGDRAWDSYQVELSIQMNSLDSVVSGRRAAIWLGMQWNGHTDDPERGDPDGPHDGWVPGATFMFDRDDAVLRPSEFFFRDVDGDGVKDNRAISADSPIEDGRRYNFLVRNERDPDDRDLDDGLDRTFSLKVWEVGTPEPADWLLQKTMINQEPFGSFVLNAHHLDVTFGDIAFEEIPLPALQTSDVVQGEDSLEPLLAADAGSSGSATPQSAGGPTAGPPPATSDPLVSADEPALAA